MTIQDVLNKLYGVSTYINQKPLTTSISSTPTQIWSNDPTTLQMTIVNTGSNSIMIYPGNSVSATNGIFLQGNGGSYEIDFTRFANLPSLEWWAEGQGGSSTITTFRLCIQ